MHSWRKMADLLARVDRPGTLGFQADMAHTLLYILGYNEPEDAILPPGWDWSDPLRLDEALKTLTAALRPWTIDFHVAQNDATVHGSGTHDKTGHHCLPGDPNGKLDISRHAGYWLRDESGRQLKAFRHICWDGCMFPNSVMMQPQTWNDILRAMISVRDAHGWSESVPGMRKTPSRVVQVRTPPAKAKTKTKTKAAKSAKAKAVRKASGRAAVRKARRSAKTGSRLNSKKTMKKTTKAKAKKTAKRPAKKAAKKK